MGCKMETVGQWLAVGQWSRDDKDGAGARRGLVQEIGEGTCVCTKRAVGISQLRDFQTL